ncbi:MAG: type III-A CRISPR-associated protein Cas10/Csm1 [Thermoplasmata archaeon]
MYNDEDILVVSALLHDIGKIDNRTNKRKVHAELGYELLLNFLIMNNNEKDMVLNLIRYHHTGEEGLPAPWKSDQKFLKLLQLLKEADIESASHEREDKVRESEIIKKLKKIYLDVKRDVTNTLEDEYVPPYTLIKFFDELMKNTNNRGIYNIYNFQGEGTYEYIEIINEIKEYLKRFDLIDLSINKSKINTLNSILMATTRFIPSAFYYNEPNVPLYDHLKMTAAISQILYRQMNNEHEKKILLIYGDIIGVQNYIFKYFKSSSTDDKGTKRLRGRSLMIKLINDSVINYILDELNLYHFNVLFDSSDKFFILCDYSNENVNKLSNIRKNVEKYLFDIYKDINISLVWKDNTLATLNDSSLGDFIQEIIDEAGKRKYKLLCDEPLNSEFFVLNLDVDKICDKCGLRPAKDGNSCEMCSLEESIGEKIVKFTDEANSIYRTETPISRNYVEFIFDNRKYIYNFDTNDLKAECNHIEIISINNFNYLNNINKINKKATLSWKFILQGNFVPKIKDYTRSIKDLVCCDSNNKDKRSCSYLGILKGDVDNMGDILREGFTRMNTKYHYNFTKYSAFSFYTNVFFTLILNKIAKDNDIYLAYSGGDDLVAIGEINQLISFSEQLNKLFRYWFYNPFITISVGVSVVDVTYPLWKGINISEEELKKSKTKGKNRITIFDNTMEWGSLEGDKFEKYISISNEIFQSIKNNNLGKGFTYYILDVEKNYSQKMIISPEPYLNYYLKRNWYKGDSSTKSYEDLMNSIISNIENISFSAILTILRLRKEELEKNCKEVK